jgi:MFS family permease
MSLARAGTTVSLTAFGSALVAFFASVYLRRTGYRVPLVSGLVIMSLAFWFLSVGARGISPYWWLALGMLGLGVGSGVFQPAANNAMLQRAPDRIGAVTGLRSTVLQSGSILWVALQTAALARGRHAALVHAHLLWVTALVLAAAAAACMRMEDHRGSW